MNIISNPLLQTALSVLIVALVLQLRKEVGRGPGNIDGKHRRIARPKPRCLRGRRKESVSAEKLEFVVDSLFLAEVWQYLCRQGQTEVFHYVGGHEIEPNRLILSHLIPVAHEHQSQSGAKADASSSIWALEQLDKWGVAVVGHFHCHPGVGRHSTHPSGVDRRFVSGLAAGGYDCVGGIASQDGFIRFYADKTLDFSVTVIGKHVREVERNVFRLDYELADGQLPVSVPRTLNARAGLSVRPSRPSGGF